VKASVNVVVLLPVHEGPRVFDHVTETRLELGHVRIDVAVHDSDTVTLALSATDCVLEASLSPRPISAALEPPVMAHSQLGRSIAPPEIVIVPGSV